MEDRGIFYLASCTSFERNEMPLFLIHHIELVAKYSNATQTFTIHLTLRRQLLYMHGCSLPIMHEIKNIK